MGTMTFIVVFDFGTSGGKCVLFNEKGLCIAVKYAELSYSSCPLGAKSAPVFDADQFFSLFCRLSRKIIDETGIRAEDIIAVAVTSQRQGMAFIDEQGKELYSAPCVDLRGASSLAALLPRTDEIKNITGISPHGMFGLARLLWFKEHAPEILKKTRKIMMLSDWLAYRLSGNVISEASNAASSQLFDVNTLHWSLELSKQFDIPADIFPSLVPAPAKAGGVQREAAAASGLPEGIPVFSAGGDTLAALVGMGALEPGILAAVAGSTTPVMLTTDKPLRLPRADTVCHIVPELWCLEANVKFSGIALRWTRDRIPPSGMDKPFERMAKEAATVPIGAGGVRAYLGSVVVDEDINEAERLGGFIFPVPWNIDEITSAHLYRAAFESILYPVRANAEYLLDRTGIKSDTFLVCGGLAKSEFFLQALTDLLNRPVTVPFSVETTALGGALLAAVGTGLYRNYKEAAQNMTALKRELFPIEANAGEYEKAYIHWRNLRKKLGEGGL